MVPSPPSPRRGGTHTAGSNAIGNGGGSSSSSINHRAVAIQHRRNPYGGPLYRPIAARGRPSRTATRRKWIGGGDGRKRSVVELAMIIASVCFWASVFRIEYSALTGSGSSGNTDTKSIIKRSIRPDPGANKPSSESNTTITIPGKQPRRPGPGANKSRNTGGHDYDSIFCPASTFRKQDGEPPPSSSRRRRRKETDPRATAQNRSKPVFLWGIPSTQSEFETGRRELLRKTYLGFYRQLLDDTNYRKSTHAATLLTNDTSYDTICSLHDWTCNATVRADCKMIYVFFVGGHANQSGIASPTSDGGGTDGSVPPPILLNESITNYRDMLLPIDSAKGFDLREPGTVYLNIRENQFDGKMTTWFKFASLVANEYNSDGPRTPSSATASVGHLGGSKSKSISNAKTNSYTRNDIEYIFKVDSDLILFTPHFFFWFEKVHNTQRNLQGLTQGIRLQQEAQAKGATPSSSTTQMLVRRVYGGIEFPATNCVENFTFDHPCPLPLSGPSYMSGELNFVSVDLATYIASDDCPREKWTIPHEDVSLSNYVYSYTDNTAYHKREEREENERRKVPTTKHDPRPPEKDYSLHVVGISTSSILLLPNMRADWETVNIRKTPDILRNGELLWAHSIKRGNHSQYLYWKKDRKFRNFWTKIFYKAVTTTGNATFAKISPRRSKQKANKTKGKDPVVRGVFRRRQGPLKTKR